MSTLYAPVDTLWSRVIARIERTSAGCWLWQGALNSQGYGCICSGRRSKSALVHHIAIAADGRPVPDGLTVDHQCHNGDRSCPGGTICQHRRCVNPAHLAIVTVGDNQRARFADGLCSKGHALSTRKDGKRFCRTCATDYSRKWTKALTSPTVPAWQEAS